jgi:hypothetical protein
MRFDGELSRDNSVETADERGWPLIIGIIGNLIRSHRAHREAVQVPALIEPFDVHLQRSSASVSGFVCMDTAKRPAE